jgi:hypothetical protein
MDAVFQALRAWLLSFSPSGTRSLLQNVAMSGKRNSAAPVKGLELPPGAHEPDARSLRSWC